MSNEIGPAYYCRSSALTLPPKPTPWDFHGMACHAMPLSTSVKSHKDNDKDECRKNSDNQGPVSLLQ